MLATGTGALLPSYVPLFQVSSYYSPRFRLTGLWPRNIWAELTVTWQQSVLRMFADV